MSENNYLGNGSTIVKYILIMIATRALTLAAAHGINLPITETQLAEILGVLLGFVIATIDAKYPNNIFNTIFNLGILKVSEDETPEEEIFDNDAPVERDDYEI